MNTYEKVKKFCKDNGKTIAETERESGLSNGAISKWGDSVPSAKNLLAVAKTLGVSIEDLIGEEA